MWQHIKESLPFIWSRLSWAKSRNFTRNQCNWEFSVRLKDFPKQVFNRLATLKNIKLLVLFCFALLHCSQYTMGLFCLWIFTNVATSFRSKHFPGYFSYKKLTKFSSSDHFSAYWLMINTLTVNVKKAFLSASQSVFKPSPLVAILDIL